MVKEVIFGKTLDELKVIAKDLGFPAFVAKQLADWLYKKKVRSFDEMLNISKNRITSYNVCYTKLLRISLYFKPSNLLSLKIFLRCSGS